MEDPCQSGRVLRIHDFSAAGEVESLRFTVKIDLFHEEAVTSVSGASRTGDEAMSAALERIEAAEEAGFHCAWLLQPLPRDALAHPSTSDVLVSAAAARTQHIRIGCGLTILPSPYHHPIRLAERIATLDIISNGRVEWVTAPAEAAEPASSGDGHASPQATWQEVLAMIRGMWKRGEPYSHHSESFEIPERDILPKPVQDPHPALWTIAWAPQAWRLAGQLGIGVLDLEPRTPMPALEEDIARYRESLANAEPGAAAINGRVGVLAMAHENRAHLGEAGHWIEVLEARQHAGCDRVLIAPAQDQSQGAVLHWIQAFGKEIIPYFKRK